MPQPFCFHFRFKTEVAKALGSFEDKEDGLIKQVGHEITFLKSDIIALYDFLEGKSKGHIHKASQSRYTDLGSGLASYSLT